MDSIGIILASVREGRRGEAYAKWIHGKLAVRADVNAELLDLKEWRLPPYELAALPLAAEKSYAEGTLPHRWAEKIRSLDGFIIVTPEYNHGYPGQLKNALDSLYTPWTYKPVAFLSYGGSAGGARAVEQLCGVAVELRMIPLRDAVNLSLIGLALDEHGFPAADLYQRRAGQMLDELLFWTRAARAARAGRRSP